MHVLLHSSTPEGVPLHGDVGLFSSLYICSRHFSNNSSALTGAMAVYGLECFV